MKDRKTVIEVKDLTVGYNDAVLLEHLNFSVYEGEIFVIVGVSGCGKSTVLKNMIGLYSPISGDITINKRSIVKAEQNERDNILRRFGVLYQSSALFSSMTLEENISLPLQEFTNLSKEVIGAISSMKLGLVGLEGYEDFKPAEISGGMKKRAGLARAMALDPEILFFDEPSAGLDPISSADLDKLILEVCKNSGTTMVIVTHELESIFTIADRVIILDKESKGIIEEGKPEFLRDHSKNPWVRKFFNSKLAKG